MPPLGVAADAMQLRQRRAVRLADIEDVHGLKAPELLGGLVRGRPAVGVVGLVAAGDSLWQLADQHRRDNDDALLAGLHEASEFLPAIEAGHASGVRSLHGEERAVPEAVLVEAGHRLEVRPEGVASACFDGGLVELEESLRAAA